MMVDRDLLGILFDADLAEGRLFWRTPPKNHPRLRGTEAGTPRRIKRGQKLYWYVKVERRAYKRAHLIFFMAHGRWPTPCVDHIDGNSENDCLANLREATTTQNAWNHKSRAKSSPLPMGVKKLKGRYQARISCNKTAIHLGTFDTPEEAHGVYLAKRKELFGEYA